MAGLSARGHRPILLAALSAWALTLAAAQGFVPAPSNVGLAPTRLETFGLRHYYQVPDSPTGTLVLIHGCGPGANSFFPYDPQLCPECLGLPEYIAQTKQALARGYAVLALQAADVGSGCWSSSTANGRVDDRPQVVATISDFLANNTALSELPLYMQGYSSGGTMCLKLPEYLRGTGSDLTVDGLIPNDVAPRGGFNAEDDADPTKLKEGLDYPPTVFVLMQLGKARERAPAMVEFLQNNGVPAGMVVSFPRQVTPTWFSDRIPGVSQAQSEELVALMGQLGSLDAQGFMVPGSWPLDAAAAQLPWLADPLVRNAVATEMGMAAGGHNNIGDYTAAALAWLESGGEADLDALVKELTNPKLAELTAARQAPPPSPAPAGDE